MDVQFAAKNKGDEYMYDMERQQAAHERQAFMNKAETSAPDIDSGHGSTLWNSLFWRQCSSPSVLEMYFLQRLDMYFI